MTATSASPASLVSPCGPDDPVVFRAILSVTGEQVCICLQPGLFYGFHIGRPGQRPRIAFSVDGATVTGDYDWVQRNGADWASLVLSHEGAAYTVRVSRPASETSLPQGSLRIAGSETVTHALKPASILHDLPLA